MGLLDQMLGRFLRTQPRWQYPANEVLYIGDIDHDYNKVYPTHSRSSPGTTFEVNPYKLSCTCPGFKKSRGEYGGRDVRRVCPHILKTLRQLGLERNIPHVLRLVLQHGREYRRFRRIKGSKADIVFGFSKRSPEVGVFAIISDQEIRGVYDLDRQTWLDAPPPRHEPALMKVLRKTFRMR